jgi:uncharacterized protein
MTLLLKLTAAFLALYGAVFAGALLLQRRLIYFPDPTHVSPEAAGLTGIEEVTIAAPDGERIIAWYTAAKSGAPTILYFHGNAGGLDTRSERFHKYTSQGYGVFMMAYRGYGGSTGSPSERANVSDAKLAYHNLMERGVKSYDVFVYGESLGTGVATQVAVAREVGGLILDAPFTSMTDMARVHHPYLPARWFLIDRYETRRHIANLKAPLLVLHGEADEVIPVSQGRAVFDAARDPKKMAVFPEAGHSDHHHNGSYDVLYRWISEIRSNPPP